MPVLLNPSRLLPPPSFGVVQVKSASSNGSSTSVVLDAAPTEGNVLLVFSGTASNSDLPSLIGGYTSIQNTSVAQGYFRTMWKEAGAAESATITASRSGSSTITQLTVMVLEISGLDTASLVDQSASNDSSTMAVSSISTGTTAATDQVDEIACAFALWYDDDFATPTWTNSFISQTSGSQTSTNVAFGVSWAAATKILNTTGAQETTSDWSSGEQPEEALAAIVTFRAA
ncbi:hypothetical protein HBA54_27680 [Pelagibius litoralis]|uniref:Uncharacterized protein n=1 Tax=Pelagibius litoralis TaxID=374515 RepID=A0A967KFC5_9PROT|nr:hypothetical protein [Pelagibius litoralis]NIA72374.1 hypothetical protein [Pelagibius litoralis]